MVKKPEFEKCQSVNSEFFADRQRPSQPRFDKPPVASAATPTPTPTPTLPLASPSTAPAVPFMPLPPAEDPLAGLSLKQPAGPKGNRKDRRKKRKIR